MIMRSGNSRVWLVVLSIGFLGLTGCKKDEDDDEDKFGFVLEGAGAEDTSLLGTPSVANLNVYQFAISKSKQCEDPIVVFEHEDGESVDMNDSPELGSGDVANGAYECVILEMDDLIAFTPSETDGNCTADEEVEIDVCREGSSTTLTDGTEVDCSAGETDRVAVYISTASAGTDEADDAFNPPTKNKGDASGINLDSKLVVSAALTGIFKMDTTDKVESGDDGCDLQPPVFSFEKKKKND